MKIFHLPDLGEGLAEAEIHAWHVQVGDVVDADQPMVSVETAKAVVEVPAPWAGRIVKLYGQPGERIATHAPLVEFAGDQGSVVGMLEEGGMTFEEPATKTVTPLKRVPAIRVMPAVRMLARELGVDLATVTPTGQAGQMTADDVRAAANQRGENLHGVRRHMAEVMQRSGQEVVPATLMDMADVTAIYTDFTVRLIQAMVAGIKTEPALNATFDGRQLIRTLHPALHLGLAVDSAEGLFVPVLRDCGQQSPHGLRETINALKNQVQQRSLTPEQFQGATLMLSNFGTIAGRYATPVVVPPLVAILACGKIQDTVVAKDGAIVIRRMAPLSLTFDHRAVTGGEASRFLAAVIQSLEEGA